MKTTASLKDAIRVLEGTCEIQEKELKYQFQEALESLKPKNLAHTAVVRITESPGVRHSMFSALTSLVTGYISKRLLLGSTRNPFKKALGAVLQAGVTTAVARYRTELEIGLRHLLLRLLRGNESRVRVQRV
ncbi:MAG TPA: hypothetical protein VK470_10225 [Bacteroidota bacterium]|nr:hypothetical protein [Bacteroidota bacterium]